MALFGVDVHPQYQDNIDFREVASDGYKFAFVKASQGDTGIPPGFLDYFSRADKAVEVAGFYHFLDATMNGAAQANMFINAIRRAGGSQNRLLAVDFEPYRGDGWNFDPTNGHLKSFISRVKELTDGHPVICYTMHSYWNSGVPSGDPAQYDIDAMWEAQVWYTQEQRRWPKAFYENTWKPWYAERPRLMYEHAPTLFRQFTWGGHVGGLYVDTDAFEGDMDDLKRLTRS